MIEIIENILQVTVLAGCSVFVMIKAIYSRKREWMLLFMFYILYMFSTLYYLLFQVYYDVETTTHTSEFGWYISYMILVLLLQNVRDKGMDFVRYRQLWLIPVFTGGMAVFYIYISEGDYISNIVAATLMAILIWNAVKGSLYNKKKNRRYPQKLLYRSVLIFCTVEYFGWTASCFWIEDSLLNLYYWGDILLTLSFVLFIPSVKRLVEK